MYVFRIAHKQVMSGRFNFLILVVKDLIDTATLPVELRLYLSKISLIASTQGCIQFMRQN